MTDLVQLYLTARGFCWEGYYEDLLDLIEANEPSTLQELGCVTNEDGKTLLHVAIMRRNIDIVLALVENDVLNPASMDEYMEESTIVDDLSTIMLLVNKYFDVAEESLFDCMFIAAELGYRNLVEYFHSTNEETIHIAAADTGLTPLHAAVKGNHVEVVKYFLFHSNASVTIRDKSGHIPEDYAVSDAMLDLFDAFAQYEQEEMAKENTPLDTSAGSTRRSLSTSSHSAASILSSRSNAPKAPRKRINLSSQHTSRVAESQTQISPRNSSSSDSAKLKYGTPSHQAQPTVGKEVPRHRTGVRGQGLSRVNLSETVPVQQQSARPVRHLYSNHPPYQRSLLDTTQQDSTAQLRTEFQSIARNRRSSSPHTSPTIRPKSSTSPTAKMLASPTSPTQRLSLGSHPSPTQLPVANADGSFDKYNVRPSKHRSSDAVELPPPAAASYHLEHDEAAQRQEMETLKTASKWEPFKLAQTNIIKDMDIHELTPQEQGITATYFKMSKLGIPIPSIHQKMNLDGMNVDLVRKVMKLLGADDLSSTPLSAAQHQDIAARKKFIKLHWSAVDVVHPESFWKQMGDAPKIIREEEIESLEKVFSIKQTSTVIRPAKDANKHLPRALDIQRANNIAIGLANFKDIGSNRLILNAVCSLDDLHGRLSVDRLLNLSSLLPTIPEAKAVRGVSTHNKGELFAQLAVEYFPHIAGRLSCFLTMVQFSETKNSVMPKLEMLISCMHDIMQNKKLVLIMQQLLAIGNTLNSSHVVDGFSISSLPRVIQMKGNDKKTSVLEFALQMLQQKGHSDILLIVDELKPSIEKASVLSLSSLYSDITDIVKEFEEIREQLHMAEEYLEFYYQSATDSWLQAELLGKKYKLKKNDYVTTPYGDGRVIEVRKDSIVIKPTKWLLFSEVQHMLYIHPSLVTVRSPFVVGDLVVCNHGSGVVKELSIVDNIAVITPMSWGKSSISTPKIYSPIVSLRPLINYEKLKMNTQSDMPILTHRFVDRLCNFAKLSQDSIKHILDLKASLQHHVNQFSKYFNEDPEKFDIIETINILKTLLNVIGKVKEAKEIQERKERLKTGSFTRYVPPSKVRKNTNKKSADSSAEPSSHVPYQASQRSERATEASHRQFVRRMKYVHVGESSSSSDSENDNKNPHSAAPVDNASDSEISSVSSDDEIDGMIRLNQSVIRSGGFMNQSYISPSSVRKQVMYNDHRRKEPLRSNKRRDMARDYVQRLEGIQQRKYVEKLPMFTYDERRRMETDDTTAPQSTTSVIRNGHIESIMLPDTPKFRGIVMGDSSEDEYEDGSTGMSELETLRSRVNNLIAAASQPLPAWRSQVVDLMSSSDSDSGSDGVAIAPETTELLENISEMIDLQSRLQSHGAEDLSSAEMESLEQFTRSGVPEVCESVETEEERQRKSFFNSLNHLLDGLNLSGLSPDTTRAEPVPASPARRSFLMHPDVPSVSEPIEERIKYDPEVEELVIQCIQLRMDTERFIYDMDQVLAGIDAEYADIKIQADALCERIEKEQDDLAAEIRQRLDDEVNGAYLHIEELVYGRKPSRTESEDSRCEYTSLSSSSTATDATDTIPCVPVSLSTPQEFSGSLDDFMSQQAEENAHLASLMSRCQNLLTMSVAEICYEQDRQHASSCQKLSEEVVQPIEQNGSRADADNFRDSYSEVPFDAAGNTSDLAGLMSRCHRLLNMSVEEVCNSSFISPQKNDHLISGELESDNESTELDSTPSPPAPSLDMPDMASLMSRCSLLLHKSVDEICEELDKSSDDISGHAVNVSTDQTAPAEDFYMKLD